MEEIYRLGKKFLILIIIVYLAKAILSQLFMQFSTSIIPYSLFDSTQEYREKLHLINNYVLTSLTYLTGLVIAIVLLFEIKEEKKQLYGLAIITIIKPLVGVILLLINRFYKFETSKNNEKK